MQKLTLAVCTSLFLFSACDNELDLTAAWKDIPVVYGVLSPADTAHYLRIEKAFLDPSKSALELARIPDSLYYASLDVDLVNTSTNQRFQMERVDGAAEGYPREDGVFAEFPNYLYKIRASEIGLVPGQRYRLEIDRSEQLPLVTAEATIVGRPTINRPQDEDRIRFQRDNSYKFLWSAAPGASFYDLYLYFNYTEFNINDPQNIQPRQEVWKVSGVITSNELDVPGLDFFEFLAASIEEDPALRRNFTGIDVRVRAGGSELYEFQRVQLANSGITSAGGDIPVYTNLSEGVGIFSSANEHIRFDIDLHESTIDSLKDGSLTEDLNFQ